MKKFGPRNPLLKRLLLLFLIFIIVCVIALFTVFTLKKSSNQVYFNLGNIVDYHEEVITSVHDYQEFLDKYKIDYKLTQSDFDKSDYVISFQTFDKCSEKRPKNIHDIKYNDNTVNISFDIHNKCGWCKSEVLVYIIKIGYKVPKDTRIQYIYNYDNELDCGSI